MPIETGPSVLNGTRRVKAKVEIDIDILGGEKTAAFEAFWQEQASLFALRISSEWTYRNNQEPVVSCDTYLMD